MNSSLINIIRISLDSSIIVSSSISICLSLLILAPILVQIVKITNSPNRVPLLLTANMYLSICLYCTMMLDTYVRSLNARLYQIASIENDLCRIRGYFTLVMIGGIFYSNMLQAIFRLCRVIFYTRPLLQKFHFYIIMIALEWIICCLWIVPSLLLNDFEYFVYDFQCQISFFNRRGTYYNVFVTYVIPISVTIGSYIYTVRKTRQMNYNLRHDVTQIQLTIARRDTIVLFRICLLLIPMLTFAVPSTIVYIIHIVDGYQPWWSIQIEWLSCVLSMIAVNIILVYVSPHVRNLWPPCRQRGIRTENIVVSTMQKRTG